MLRLLAPPNFKDSDKTEKAKIFYKLVIGSSIFITVLELFEWYLIPQDYIRWLSILISFNLISLGLLLLNKKGYNYLAASLFIAICILIVTYAAYTSEGIRAPAVQYYLVLVIAAGLILSWRDSLITGIVAAIFGFLLVIFEDLAIFPPHTVIHTSLSTWLNSIVSIGLLILLQYFTVANLNKAFKRAKTELKLRKKVEEELKGIEAFRKTVFENSKLPMVIMEASTLKFIDCNQAAIDIYGFSSLEEAIGKTPTDVSAPYQYDGTPSSIKNPYFIHKALKEGAVAFEWKHQRPNGEFWDAEVHLISFKMDNIDYLQFTLVDITERKNSQQALQESERKARAILDSSFSLIGLLTPEGTLLEANKTALDFTGAKISEVVGRPFWETPWWTHSPEMQNHIKVAIKSASMGNLVRSEATHLSRDGKEHTVDFTLKPVTDENGKVILLIPEGRDITENKQAEKTQQIITAQLRANLENTSFVAVQWFDENGILLYWNPASEKIYGWKSEEVIGKTPLTLNYTEEQFNNLLEIIRKTNETQLALGPFETMVMRKDGTSCWILSSIFPFPMSDGKTAFAMMNIDITARKNAENEIKESENRYRTLIETFPEIILLTDLDGNILYGNKALENTIGITPEDYRNPNRKAHIHPDDRPAISKAIKELLESNKNQTEVIENRFIDTWGRTHWLSGIIAKIYLNEQLVLQTITRDITEKKKIEQELEKYRMHLERLVQERTDELASANEELRATNEELFLQKEELEATLTALQTAQNKLIHSEKMASLGVLSAGIAHEINNPLNFIHGGASAIRFYMEENLPSHFDDILPLLDAIDTGVKRASAIVSSLSHYSRGNDLAFEKCEMHSIIDNCLIMLQNQLKNKIKIIKNFAQESLSISGNEGKLHQAILNIIANAEQSIETTGSITITTEKTENMAQITIADTGHGISEENLQKIFDPFFTTKAPGKGTGLGLSIAFNIIQEHNGKIKFDSAIDLGTKVIIKLPLDKS